MGAKLEIHKVCMFCGRDFIAHKTTTQTCSDNCAKRLYKLRKRGERIELAQIETARIKARPLELVKGKEFLTIRDLAALLSCSRRTAYRLIEQGTVKAVNLAQRKTLVKRTEIDKLFI